VSHLLDFEQDGVAILPSSVSNADIETLRSEFSQLEFKAGARPFALTASVRRLIAPSGCFGQALAALGLGKHFPVRVLAFDKTPQSNWNLGWHQDRVIAVKARQDADGFSNWTVKNGRPHVEAPLETLNRLLSLRLHLDECGRSNGALRAICGSFRLGKLRDAEVRNLAATKPSVFCEAGIGEIVAMKALTVHASSPSEQPLHRRVLHVDYCDAGLPDGLEWALDP